MSTLDTTNTTTSVPVRSSIDIRSVATDGLAYYVADVVIGDDGELGTIVKSGLTSDVAKSGDYDLVINGDYFTYRNNGIVIRNGEQILYEPRRQGMAISEDGEMFVYNESNFASGFLEHIRAKNAFSFGPILVSNGLVSNNVDDYYEVDEGRSINGKHPRTGICMVQKNHFILVVVDGRSPGYSNGITLGDFARLFQSFGCRVAYNLDGGGSSVMWADGKVVNNPLGKHQERTNGDAIYVRIDD